MSATISLDCDVVRFHVDYETTEHGVRYTVNTVQDSFWNVLALMQTYLSQMSPISHLN